jgi:Mg-chelatase subunit ChlD
MIDILVILDRSGSMQDAVDDHVGGLKSFIQDQQKEGDDAYFTLVQFDTQDPCDIVFDRLPIRDVPLDQVRLIPRGSTPLLDAIGKAMAHLEAKQAVKPTDATVVMIVTDGEENASHEWTLAQVKDKLAKAEKHGTKVLYLGANVDAFSEASKLGMAAASAANFNMAARASVQNVYHVTSQKLARSRGGVRGQSSSGATPDEINVAWASSMSYTVSEQEAILKGEPVPDDSDNK